MKLGMCKKDPRAVIPEFATGGSACFDIVAIDREVVGRKVVYSTGLAFEIPDGYCVEVYSRSGHGFKEDMRLSNCVGIIDADYTGEVKVKMSFDGSPHQTPSWPWSGERVAQGKLVKLVKTEIIEVLEQKETERADGGFGSTGK